MGRKRKGRGFEGAEAEDFVPAVVARTAEEAEEYRELLNDHDIPAIIHEDDEERPARPGRPIPAPRKGMSRGVPVLVPEAMLDEASEVIADRDYHHLQPGEEIEEEEEEDELGEVPIEGGAELDGDGSPRPKPKSKPSDNPFDEEEEDAFDVEEADEEEVLLEGEDLDEDEDVEEEDEEEEEEVEEEAEGEEEAEDEEEKGDEDLAGE